MSELRSLNINSFSNNNTKAERNFMMINKRLINMVSNSKKYIFGNVLMQWFSLIANISLMLSITVFLKNLFNNSINTGIINVLIIVAFVAIVVRFLCTMAASHMSYLASKSVKKTLRKKIYEKILYLGASYNEKVSTSQVVQMSVEGVEQLEMYFGAYLPQFFYSMLAPITLFAVLSFVNFYSAVILLICVPLIPIAIAAVQTVAKKLFSKYWGKYTSLGDTFLENLQGLTTLKIYQADCYKNEQMNKESEEFRKITMKVLTMQLNSITIMDFISYGGAALGAIIAVNQFRAGNVDLAGCLLIILLSADFFIPMRQLGSFFHVAMNGIAASDKIFNLLDIPEQEQKTKIISSKECKIICDDLRFSYNDDREILKDINIDIPNGSFTAIVGESGSGKSTIASILMGRNKNYQGSVTIGGTQLSEIGENSIMENITYIGHNSYIFKGTVRENLLMGDQEADDKKLWNYLIKVKLADFLENEQGLDMGLLEKGSNLSGGQRQRLALARALLHDSAIYIFDEATSNIDVESENDIMEQIHKLSDTKTVILISHRLANVADADFIYVLENGYIAEKGTHEQLLQKHGVYKKLWSTQQNLENFQKEAE